MTQATSIQFSTADNTSFSRQLPGLQLAVDSTSLGDFKTCARKYFYSTVLGYQARGESPHLTFGLLMHSSVERYAHYRAADTSMSHDDALDSVLDWALRATWNKALARPWTTDHPASKIKNRMSLLRSIVWYLDQFGKDDPLQTVILPSGKPATELSFRFDSGYTSSKTGEMILFCGHLDRLATFNGLRVIPDLKTTGHSLDAQWFSSFTPDNQFSMYALAARVAFDFEVKDLIVDGMQVGVGFTRFARGLVQRDDAQIAEWHKDAGIWLEQMEKAAVDQYWPQNDKSCSMYGGCQFRAVCSRSPSAREQWLKQDYRRRIWDPSIRRGDI